MKRILLLTLFCGVFLLSRAFGQQPGTIKWCLTLSGDRAFSCLSLSPDGTLYVARHSGTPGAGSGTLWSINAAAMTTNWVLNFTNNDGCEDTPAVGSDGTLYLGTGDYQFSALNPANGSNIWVFDDPQQETAFDPTSPLTASAAVAPDGTLYVANWTTVYALTNTTSLTNSAPKWEFDATAYLAGYNFLWYASPAVGLDGTVYVTSISGQLIALNSNNGTLRWATPAVDFSGYMGPNGGCSPAIGTDGTIYFGIINDFFAVNPSGSVRWSYQAKSDDAFQFSPVIGPDGTVYAAVIGYSTPTRLLAFNPNGSVKWTNQLAGLQTGNTERAQAVCAVAANGLVYFADTDGKLYAFNADGTTNWVCQTTNGPLNAPVVAPDGTIYAQAYEDNQPYVYAINGSGPVGCSNWPLYGKNARRTAAVMTAAVGSPMLTDSGFQVTVSGATNVSTCLCASSDLRSWTNIGGVVITGSTTNFVDNQATNYPRRFYRAIPQ